MEDINTNGGSAQTRTETEDNSTMASENPDKPEAKKEVVQKMS
jgi:hypothetical protein